MLDPGPAGLRPDAAVQGWRRPAEASRVLICAAAAARLEIRALNQARALLSARSGGAAAVSSATVCE
jgi:hypothetical protein